LLLKAVYLQSTKFDHAAVTKAATYATNESQHICDTRMQALKSGQSAVVELQTLTIRVALLV
jgi:hypothetical protein